MRGMPPTIAASVVARAAEVAIADGLSPRAVAALLGRPLAALTTDARVPVDAMFALFAAALRHGRDPAFPLRVARAVRPDDYAALGFALERAATADEAFTRLVRYGHAISDSGGWQRVDGSDGLELRWVRAGRRTLGHRAANECAVAELLGGLRRALGPTIRPVATHFRHAAPGDARAHAAWFGQIRWGSTWDGVVLPRAIGTARPPAGDAALSRFFEDLLRRQADPRRAALSARVREQLVADLPAGIPSARDLAQRLGLSERSLRRGLATEGHSYRALVDDHRQVCAHDLRAAGKPATEVAFLLGFSDTSAFSRAYRRWYGTSWRATAARPR